MLEQEVTVVSVEGEMAWVEGERKSACGQCSVRGGCGSGIIQSAFSPKPVRFAVVNSRDAKTGDHVVIGVDERAFLRGSLSAYLLPILALVTGAWLGEALFPDLGQAAAISGGVIGLFAALYRLKRRFSDPMLRTRYQPQMLRKLEQGWIPVKPHGVH